MANTYTYQWQDSPDGATGWANITGQTSATYTVGAGENTKYLRCNVTATNDGGNATQASNVLGPVTNVVTHAGPPKQYEPSAQAYQELLNLGYNTQESGRVRTVLQAKGQ